MMETGQASSLTDLARKVGMERTFLYHSLELAPQGNTRQLERPAGTLRLRDADRGVERKPLEKNT